MLGALLRGVSTREYQEVLPQMAETVGVSRSAISRKAVEASAEQLKQLQERRWENAEILVIYIDGQRFGEHHILSAVGVDVEGKKHILGIESGATENAASVKRLLTHLRDHGLPTDRKYLFVIDGAKALRAAIEEVFGDDQPVQRCRNHKLRNVLDELPKEQHGQPLNLMRAAWRVKTAEEGEKRLEQLARFLEEPDRGTREGAWVETACRRLRDRAAIDGIFDRTVPLRVDGEERKIGLSLKRAQWAQEEEQREEARSKRAEKRGLRGGLEGGEQSSGLGDLKI